MFQLSEDDLREFRKIWKKEFHEVISLEQAEARARELLELYLLMSKPLPGEKVRIPSRRFRTMMDIRPPKSRKPR